MSHLLFGFKWFYLIGMEIKKARKRLIYRLFE